MGGYSQASRDPDRPLKPSGHQEPAPTKDQAGPSHASTPTESPALAMGAPGRGRPWAKALWVPGPLAAAVPPVLLLFGPLL